MLSGSEAPLQYASRRHLLTALTACALVIIGVAQAQAATTGKAPTAAEVRTAVEKVAADANLERNRKTRVLKWKDGERQRQEPTGFMRWLVDMFKWLGATARILMWALISVLAAVLVVAILRQLRRIQSQNDSVAGSAPTHVRDLDIRPESLPDDIGAAALSLWEKGEQRAALSLLYRGLLSRLVHAYNVPIRESSTEGDCLLLAERRLPLDAAGYASRLVRTWQRAVYGGKQAEAGEVRDLCADFNVALNNGVLP